MRQHIRSIETHPLNPNEVNVTFECPGCHKLGTKAYPKTPLMAWVNGTLIQNAFPTFTPDEREALQTGYCPECWDRLFGELSDDDDESGPTSDDPATWDKAEDSHIDQTPDRE